MKEYEEKETMTEENSFGKKMGKLAGDVGRITINMANTAEKKTAEMITKTKTGVTKSKDAVMDKLDVNGDGKVDVEDIIILGMRIPGIRIHREEFLRKELSKNYSDEVVEMAILQNPSYAGISVEEMDRIAEEIIIYERNCVSGISAALGTPGGLAMAATIPADIAQYYGYLLRAAQKLLYLYGFPEIHTGEDGQELDTETINILTLCMGVMYGVAGANNAIKAMAKALASGVEKQLLKKALTKGTIYPIVKNVAKWFSVNMTKQVFAGFFKNAIPVIGGVIGGGLTFVTFKPCCVKLQDSLRDTLLSNPDTTSSGEGTVIDSIAEDIKKDEAVEETILEEMLSKDDFELSELQE